MSFVATDASPRTAAGDVVRAVIPAPVLERIRARAVRAYPEECCGLLIGVRAGDAVLVRDEIDCPNVADGAERTRRFMIEPKILLDVTRALREGEESLVGIYHSHPDAEATPSRTDRTFVGLWPETVWLIVPVGDGTAGEERAWWLPLGGSDSDGPRELRVSAAEGTSPAGADDAQDTKPTSEGPRTIR